MAKQLEDKQTVDLLSDGLAPAPAKRGRKPTLETGPMSAAARKRVSRMKSNKVTVDINRLTVEIISRRFPDMSLDQALIELLFLAEQ